MIKNSDQSKIIEQVKFTYSPLEKSLEKPLGKIYKSNGISRKKLNRCLLRIKKRQVGLINNDNNLSLKKTKQVFHKLTKNRLNERKKLTNEINFCLYLYFNLDLIHMKRTRFKSEEQKNEIQYIEMNERELFDNYYLVQNYLMIIL